MKDVNLNDIYHMIGKDTVRNKLNRIMISIGNDNVHTKDDIVLGAEPKITYGELLDFLVMVNKTIEERDWYADAWHHSPTLM